MKKPVAPRKPKKPISNWMSDEYYYGHLYNHESYTYTLKELIEMFNDASDRFNTDVENIQLKINIECNPDGYGWVDSENTLSLRYQKEIPADQDKLKEYEKKLKEYEEAYAIYRKKYAEYKKWKDEVDRQEKIKELKKELKKLEG